jgi:hypothetical protein
LSLFVKIIFYQTNKSPFFEKEGMTEEIVAKPIEYKMESGVSKSVEKSFSSCK